MQVTFMIGNGFDISLGLNTRYRDFYEYLQNNSDQKNNDIIENILTNMENIELWSDLELGLGEYTKTIGNDNKKLEKFYEDKFDLEIRLKDYLRIEQDKIDWKHSNTTQNIKNSFGKYIYEFYNLLKPTEKDEVLKIINKRDISCKIVSFNYTNILENCIKSFGNKIDLLYLHGSLEDDNAILGVNDFEQINNEFFKSESDMLISMCKLEINSDIGEYSTENAEGMIRNSEILCIYGMSIGDTDKYWWNRISTNISHGNIKMVIVYHYNPNLDMKNRVQVRRMKENIKEQLLKYFSGNEEEKISLKSKIMVLCNLDMFKIDLTFKGDSEFESLLKDRERVV